MILRWAIQLTLDYETLVKTMNVKWLLNTQFQDHERHDAWTSVATQNVSMRQNWSGVHYPLKETQATIGTGCNDNGWSPGTAYDQLEKEFRC